LVWSLEMVQRCGGYTYEQGEMRGRVGKVRWGKETDGCPCKGTSICFLTYLIYILLSHCWYVPPTVSVDIWLLLYHINLLGMPDIPYWYFDPQLSGQVSCQRHRHLTSTIAHIRIDPRDPTAPSDGQQTSIFGRLGTRKLGTVVLLYHQWSDLAKVPQSVSLYFPWLNKCCVLVLTWFIYFPWLDLSKTILFKLVRLPLQSALWSVTIVKFLPTHLSSHCKGNYQEP
jgi:hypothetical protein